jgi:hypothetical protein
MRTRGAPQQLHVFSSSGNVVNYFFAGQICRQRLPARLGSAVSSDLDSGLRLLRPGRGKLGFVEQPSQLQFLGAQLFASSAKDLVS